MQSDNLLPMMDNLSLDESTEENTIDKERLPLLLKESGSENYEYLKTEEKKPPFKVCPPKVRGHYISSGCSLSWGGPEQ